MHGRACFNLTDSYVQLLDGGAARPIKVDANFWARLAERPELQEGFMVTRGSVTADWTHWEMHPEGEEVLILLSGAVDLVLDDDTRTWTQQLRLDNPVWINPRGLWHRAVFVEPAELLFITAGKGTQHRGL